MPTETAVVNNTQFVLSNGNGFEIKICNNFDDLEKIYGPRFEALGYVSSIKKGGKEFLTKEGLIDETGIKTPFGPFGYFETPIGDTFVKVGVGEIEKIQENNYRFHFKYNVKNRSVIKAEKSSLAVKFTEEMLGHNYYKYTYTKEYSIDPNNSNLNIKYKLENRGEKALITEQYNHNWFHLGGEGNYSLKVNTSPIAIFDEPCDSDVFLLDSVSNTIDIPIPFKKPSFVNYTRNASPQNNELLLSRSGDSSKVAIKGDFVASHVAVYGQEDIVCPEIFVKINLQPGDTYSWLRFYEFN